MVDINGGPTGAAVALGERHEEGAAAAVATLGYDPVPNMPITSRRLRAAMGDPNAISGHKVGPDLIRRYILYRSDPANDKKFLKHRAVDLGVGESSITTLDRLPGMFDEVRRARFKLYRGDLYDMDLAMFRKAKRGDVPAAKLMYERWDPEYVQRTQVFNQKGEPDELKGKSIEEIRQLAEQQLAELKRITSITGVASSDVVDVEFTDATDEAPSSLSGAPSSATAAQPGDPTDAGAVDTLGTVDTGSGVATLPPDARDHSDPPPAPKRIWPKRNRRKDAPPTHRKLALLARKRGLDTALAQANRARNMLARKLAAEALASKGVTPCPTPPDAAP